MLQLQTRRLVIITLLVLLLYGVSATAQTRRNSRSSRASSGTRTTSTATTTSATQSTINSGTTRVASGALAVLNNRTITLADLDARVRTFVESLDQRIREAKRMALETEVALQLLEFEARRRNKTVAEVLEAEVNNYVVSPTEEEIKSVYEANPDQFNGADLQGATPSIIALVRSERQKPLFDDLISRLRASQKVVMGVDINSARLAPTSVLATVNGHAITAQRVLERAKPSVYRLLLNAYEIQRNAIEYKIASLLLTAEAARRNMTPEELYKSEVTSKLREPTEEQIKKFYEENKTILKADLNTHRANISKYLQQQERERLEIAFSQSLRRNTKAQLLLTEPEPPVQAVSVDDDPARGNAQAPVTVIVFTDFECPACAHMHPIIEEVLRSYGARVRLVIRDFPLAMHPHALKAAEAANAAHAQGKFFEYMALLFRNREALDIASLKSYATQLGLDRARFDRELDSGKYAAEISKDISDGQFYGVDSTPMIFVNGQRVNLRELKADYLRDAIERAFSRFGAGNRARSTR